METIFMNTTNSKASESNRFRLYFTDKLDLRGNKTIALANLSIYYTCQNVKSEYDNNKIKIIGPTCDKTFYFTQWFLQNCRYSRLFLVHY